MCMADYFDRFRNIVFEKRGDTLLMRVHTDGGPMLWGASEGAIHAQLGDAFHAVAHDETLRAVILTGTGDAFCPGRNPAEQEPFSGQYWRRIMREGRELLVNMLDIEVPVITAVNGPAVIHPELCVMADVVLATESTYFSDSHLRANIVAGDGSHVVWKQLLGHSRGNYFLLMEEMLSARDALAFGVVHEIHSPVDLLNRAWAIADQLSKKTDFTLRYTRKLFTQPLKEALLHNLDLGLALEGLEMAIRRGGG